MPPRGGRAADSSRRPRGMAQLSQRAPAAGSLSPRPTKASSSVGVKYFSRLERRFDFGQSSISRTWQNSQGGTALLSPSRSRPSRCNARPMNSSVERKRELRRRTALREGFAQWHNGQTVSTPPATPFRVGFSYLVLRLDSAIESFPRKSCIPFRRPEVGFRVPRVRGCTQVRPQTWPAIRRSPRAYLYLW